MERTRRAVYPGTFDPITYGHLDVIERAAKIFDEVVVGVTTNPAKQCMFSLDERVRLVKECTKDMEFVTVKSFHGLLVDFVKSCDTNIIVKALRQLSDFEYEFQQAIVNRKLNPEIETVFIMTDARYFYLSSTVVREVARLGGCVSTFVPKVVERALKEKVAAERHR